MRKGEWKAEKEDIDNDLEICDFKSCEEKAEVFAYTRANWPRMGMNGATSTKMVALPHTPDGNLTMLWKPCCKQAILGNKGQVYSIWLTTRRSYD